MKYFTYCRKSTEAEDRQVLSLDSQEDGLRRLQTERWPDVDTVAVMRESRTAKTPGRPLFDEMIRRIERGEADGIMAWSPDRLARNSVDGGRIIYMLDQGLLKDLKFADFTFENTPFGKFMLGLMFINSKLYVDKLSKDVARGLDAKARLGWRPTQPPLGYITDSATRTIIPDPERFDCIKRMWQLMLTGAHSPRAILETATREWGLRTKQKKKSGGEHVSLATVYHVFSSVFYAGVFAWKGELLAGKHEPMITLDEFDRVQELLGRPGRRRPKKRDFGYTGLMRCRTCRLAITAEEKVNRFGSHYTYYHCTRRKGLTYCREPYVNVDLLEEQMAAEVGEIELHPRAKEWIFARLDRFAASKVKERSDQKDSLDRALKSARSELDALTRLHVRGLITEEEFVRQRQGLQQEKTRMEQRHQLLVTAADWIEPCRELVDFSIRAADYFRAATPAIRRLILLTVGSNPTLGAGTFRMEARKPFRRWSLVPDYSEMCGFLKDVRTLSHERNDELRAILQNIASIKASVSQPEEPGTKAA